MISVRCHVHVVKRYSLFIEYKISCSATANELQIITLYIEGISDYKTSRDYSQGHVDQQIISRPAKDSYTNLPTYLPGIS